MRDRISLERLAVLQSMGRIARVVTHRKGYVNRAFLMPLLGEPKPSTLCDYVGTKYSFRERLAGGHVAYRLRSLGESAYASESNLAPDEVRPIFLRVILDCMKPVHAPGEAFGTHSRPGGGDARVANGGAGRANGAISAPRSVGPDLSLLRGGCWMALSR